MFYYKYFNREDNDIQQLKQNLMSDSNNTESALSSARQAVNENLGKIFKKNKRRFKKIEHQDKIFMKKIIIDIKPKSKQMDILQEDEITVDIKDKKFKLLYDYKHNFLMKELKGTKIPEISNENSKKNLNYIS